MSGTLADLERAARLAPDHDSRFDFWIQFSREADPIAAGVAELRRRIASWPEAAS